MHISISPLFRDVWIKHRYFYNPTEQEITPSPAIENMVYELTKNQASEFVLDYRA